MVQLRLKQSDSEKHIFRRPKLFFYMQVLSIIERVRVLFRAQPFVHGTGQNGYTSDFSTESPDGIS